MKINTNSHTLKNAFTLAETLITIMIIGVLMALMLRTINRINPDKDKILFIKSYHAAESAVTNMINDSTKYNPTFMSENERATALADGEVLNSDFRDDPYEEATVRYITSSGTQAEKKKLKRAEAICYFMIDQLNTIGGANCSSNSGIKVDGKTVVGANFRTSNGVCFDNWYGVGTDGTLDGVIDPNCEGASKGYVVRVFRDGKMTVPETVTGFENQTKAYNWLQKQAELK